MNCAATDYAQKTAIDRTTYKYEKGPASSRTLLVHHDVF
jgi:hypothetical protein